MADQRTPVPVRTILATIGLVVATYLLLRAVVLLAHIETLLVIAAFFAVVLTPAVDLVRRKLHVSRGLSTAIVFIVGLGLVAGMLYAFIRPLVDEGREFADNFPTYVSDAREGRGSVGRLVERYNLDERLREAQASIEDRLANAGGGALKVAGRVLGGVASLLTIIVLALLMILYGPDMLRGAVTILDPPRRERVCAVAADCSRALTGYVMGNLLISVIAGSLTFVALLIFGVPFAGVLALWTAFADLIPLVGATLRAIPAAGVIQVIARDIWDHRAGTFKEEPTIGADQTPVSEVLQDDEPEGPGAPKDEAEESEEPKAEPEEPERPDEPERPIAVSE